MNVQELAGASRRIIEEQGWTQRLFFNDAGNVCILGAARVALLTEANIEVPHKSHDYIKFWHFLFERFGKSAGNWNDDPFRTQEDVILELKRIEVGE